MALPWETTSKTRIIRRAKALGVFLLPLLIAGVSFLAFSLLMRRPGTVPSPRVGESTGDDEYAVSVQKTASSTGSPELTTYTIAGVY